MEVFDTLKSIMIKELGRDFANITQDISFEELELDSLDLVQVIMAIEETFDIEINEEEAEGLTSMADAVDFVERKMCQR